MPQVQLPLFPAGTTRLNESLAFECREGQITYFNGHLPVFTHAQEDLAAFRLFTSQLVVNGSASQGDIRRAFGVPKVAVQRCVDRYRAGGAAVFFLPPKPRAGRKLTPDLLRQAQALLDQGQSVPQVSLTYHKFAGQDWAAEAFAPHELTLANGQKVTLSLAERGTCLSNGLWVREIRQREPNGHQVSLLATDYRSDLRPLAVRLFARWTQENFLKYMREHYAIDRLVEQGTEPIPETTTVVNPARRRLENEIRREQTLRDRDRAVFGALSLSAQPEPPELEAWQQQKARLHEAIATRQTQLAELKAKRNDTPRHVALKDLPKDEQFPRLRAERKHFVDTIKLIAYRAETALASTVRETLARADDGRALVRELMRTPADLHPDLAAKPLTVRLHPLPSRLQDTAARHLAEELTATETVFPATDLRLIYVLNGPP